MRRKLVLGAWYAAAIGGLLLAEERHVSVNSADLYSLPDPYAGDPVTTVHAGDPVNLTGKTDGDFLEGTANGKTGWIAGASLYTPEEYKKTLGKAGADSEAKGQEGAYAKGFDPEVEERAKQDDATLRRYIEEEVKPLIWQTMFSPELEAAEYALDKYIMQHPQSMHAEGEGRDGYVKLENEIKRLRDANAGNQAKWASSQRDFRKNGNTGEFAGRK